MIGGFTFKGIDIHDLGIEYAPDNEETYVYKQSVSNINEEIFDGRHGGYYYGYSMQPKEFILRCYYDNKHINHGLMTKINSVFKIGNSGRLVFKTRPWVYYNVVVTETDISEIYTYLTGVIKIKVKAYYPFARCDSLGFDNDDLLFTQTRVLENSALTLNKFVPETTLRNITTETSFMLYNGGTERSKVAIEITGNTGEGIDIINETTQQSCRITGFKSSEHSNQSLVIDGMSGKCFIGNDLYFLYHDCGFIELAPAYPIERNIIVEKVSDGYVSNKRVNETWIGKELVFEDCTKVIVTNVIDDYKFSCNISYGTINKFYKCFLTTYNKLRIVPILNDTNITQIEFKYKPTFQ